MFSVGQTVYHRSRKLSGKVSECEGGVVYLVQDNGVEVDFPVGDLTASAPADKTANAPAAVLSRVLTAADVTEEHRKVLAVIPPRTLQAVALLYERRAKKQRFSALDVAEKLNFIADVTAVPYRTMKAFSDRPGELGLMMGRGLSVSQGSADR